MFRNDSIYDEAKKHICNQTETVVKPTSNDSLPEEVLPPSSKSCDNAIINVVPETAFSNQKKGGLSDESSHSPQRHDTLLESAISGEQQILQLVLSNKDQNDDDNNNIWPKIDDRPYSNEPTRFVEVPQSTPIKSKSPEIVTLTTAITSIEPVKHFVQLSTPQSDEENYSPPEIKIAAIKAALNHGGIISVCGKRKLGESEDLISVSTKRQRRPMKPKNDMLEHGF